MAEIGNGPPAAGDDEIGVGRGEELRLARVDRAEGRERGDEPVGSEANEAWREADGVRYAEALGLMPGAAVGENPGCLGSPFSRSREKVAP
jgi:hypothetical protein